MIVRSSSRVQPLVGDYFGTLGMCISCFLPVRFPSDVIIDDIGA